MKLVYRLSNPLISGSEWAYELFNGFLSVLSSLVCDNRRQWLARYLGRIERETRRWFFDGGSYRQQIKQDAASTRPDHMLMVNAGDCSNMSATVQVDALLQALALNSPKDLSPVRRRQRDKAIALVREEALLDATYSFGNLQVEGIVEGNCLRVGGETLPIAPQLPIAGELTALGCGACTLGPRLEARVRQLFAEKRAALALALDYVGNELLLALGRRLRENLQADARRQGLVLGQKLQVGESELDLSARAAVLRLAGAPEIGITLQRGNLLLPQKSASMVFTVGRNLPKSSRSDNA
jgi:hypothetical protein